MLNPQNRIHLHDFIRILLLAFFFRELALIKIFMDFVYDKTRAIVTLEKVCQEAEINEVKWGFSPYSSVA